MRSNTACALAHGAIYLETREPDLTALGDSVTYTSPSHGAGAKYEFTIGKIPVTLNAMAAEKLAGHLQGFSGFVQQLPDPEPLRSDALQRISRAQCVLGIIMEPEWNDELWQPIGRLVEANGGLVFTFNSIYLADGTVLVGPMRD
ncbi:MAG: hypothetical protein EOP83_27440 [Verrucomicrobiaceae bacterium]|nr:MAG: hypothetical protein EOP83_27440 [Verrucomicrobiaceae bacterium]